MEGMIRALQPDIMGYVGLLTAALVVFVGFMYAASKLVSTRTGTEEQARSTRRIGRNIALALVALTLLAAVYRVATYSAVNRVPRNDVDGSAVYDRMKQNAEPTPPASR